MGGVCVGDTCTGGSCCKIDGDCNDGNACTKDTCDKVTFKCVYDKVPMENNPCDADKSGCTAGDKCVSGVCTPGAAVDCSNPFDVCNDWNCTSTSSTTYTCDPTPKGQTIPCDDGKFCTINDHCDGKGVCVGGQANDCLSVADQCNDATCNESLKKCEKKPKAQGTSCNDGEPCTSVDQCDAAGKCIGSNNVCGDFKVSTFKTANNAYPPALADMGSGRYLVAWAGSDGNIYGRSFRQDWSREKTEATLADSYSVKPVQVASFADGSFNVGQYYANISSCSSQGYYQSSYGCSQSCSSVCCNYYYTKYTWSYVQQLKQTPYSNLMAAGTTGTNTFVNNSQSCSCSSCPAAPATKSMFRSLGLPSGNTVWLWQDGSTSYGRIVKPDFTTVKDLSLPVSTWTDATMAAFVDGKFLVVWTDGKEIFFQPYTSAGEKDGVQIQANTNTDGAQTNPAVATQGNGRFVVAWVTDPTGNNKDVAMQVFKSDYSKLGQEVVVNTTTAGAQYNPAIGVFKNGEFAVAFQDDSGKDTAGKGIFAQFYSPTGLPNGSERPINVTTTGDQQRPGAVGLASDEVVIAWVGADSHVYARKFDKNGNALNGVQENIVNTTKTNEQSTPAIATRADGTYMIAWENFVGGANGTDISAQRFDATGKPAGVEFKTNTYATDYQLHPTLSADSTGKFVVMWDSMQQDGDLEGVYGQRYDADGTPEGVEFRANVTTANDQLYPVVSRFGDSRFAVVWHGFTNVTNYDVYARCFDASGNPWGSSASADVMVNTETKNIQQYANIAAIPDGSGKMIVVWQSYDQVAAGAKFDIYGQVMFRDCTKIGQEFKVNTTTADEQSQPVVAAQNDGTFVVGWRSAAQDGGGFGIYGQRFKQNLEADGAEFKLNAVTANDQTYPSLGYLGAGGFVATWQTVGEDEEQTAIKAQNFLADGKTNLLDYAANITWKDKQTLPRVAGFPSGSSYVIVWQSNAQDGDKGAIVSRLFK